MKKKSLEDINPSDVNEPESKKARDLLPVVTHQALALVSFKDGPGINYKLMEVGFNPTTSEAHGVKELFRGNREDAIVQFKIQVDKKGYFGE